MTANPEYLFTYGTLMDSIDNAMAQLLRKNSQHVGSAQIQGRLYRISWYPGLIDSDVAGEIVHGDLFELKGDNKALMRKLDAYEGIGDDFPQPQEYSRELRSIWCNGEIFRAMTYIYKWDVSGAERILNGRFSEV